jgi:hypothetical protein
MRFDFHHLPDFFHRPELFGIARAAILIQVKGAGGRASHSLF